MIKKLLKMVVQAAMVVGVGLLCCYVSGLLFLRFEIKRASRLFEDIHRVKIGDSDESVKALAERYGGYRWNAQLGAQEDYNYVLLLNPWCFPLLSTGKACEKIHEAELKVKPHVRMAAGFRMWIVSGEISIKGGKVVAVQTETEVEGQKMWLGANSRLSDKPREFEQSADAPDREPHPEHFASSGILNMASGAGTSWDFWTTSSSPEIQTRIARGMNFECLRPFSTCQTPCDLMPEAARSFRAYPELAQMVGGWDESLRTCIKHPDSQY